VTSALSRRTFVGSSALAGGIPCRACGQAGYKDIPKQTDREYWVSVLDRLAYPVLSNLSGRTLKAAMPVEAPHNNAPDRSQFTHLEAFGRLLCGIAPWLELTDGDGPELDLRQRYRYLARQSLSSAVDPTSPDYMNFNRGQQPVVDAAFLALAILRAPDQLWNKLETATRGKLIKTLRTSRVIQPAFSNWLLFSATVEAFLCFAREQWDTIRADYAIRQHDEWYKGEGIYADGPQLHCDYYNSSVIHPMLLELTTTLAKQSKAWDSFAPAILARAQRYAAIQERPIGPDGSFPAIGRSITYRYGAFHLLALMALRRQLPNGLTPEQVRSAMTTVMHRMTEAPGTFDKNGWLTVGFCGHQPLLAEPYISTGSLYLCSVALLPPVCRSPTPSGTRRLNPGHRKESGRGKTPWQTTLFSRNEQLHAPRQACTFIAK
jgi:hypothetical protein